MRNILENAPGDAYCWQNEHTGGFKNFGIHINVKKK